MANFSKYERRSETKAQISSYELENIEKNCTSCLPVDPVQGKTWPWFEGELHVGSGWLVANGSSAPYCTIVQAPWPYFFLSPVSGETRLWNTLKAREETISLTADAFKLPHVVPHFVEPQLLSELLCFASGPWDGVAEWARWPRTSIDCWSYIKKHLLLWFSHSNIYAQMTDGDRDGWGGLLTCPVMDSSCEVMRLHSSVIPDFSSVIQLFITSASWGP